MPTESAMSYLRSQVMSASPSELRLMLLDGAIRFAHMGKQGMADQNFEMTYEGISQCRAIVTELAVGVDRSADPDLCDRVTGIFMFMFQELTEAGLAKDPQRVQRVIELLEFERDTWKMAMDRVRQERGKTESPSTQASQPASGLLSVQA